MSGLAFEERIKQSCDVYKANNVALIHKIPTPWSVSYDNSTKRVKRAFPQGKSSVDFEGIWQGRSVAFEAKSTIERKRFELKNVQPHQLEYLRLHQEHGGISFFLIEFSKFNEVYFMQYDQMENWMKQSRNGGRRSIPYHWIMANCEIVVMGRASKDFVSVLERLKNKGNKTLAEKGTVIGKNSDMKKGAISDAEYEK